MAQASQGVVYKSAKIGFQMILNGDKCAHLFSPFHNALKSRKNNFLILKGGTYNFHEVVWHKRICVQKNDDVSSGSKSPFIHLQRSAFSYGFDECKTPLRYHTGSFIFAWAIYE